MDKIIYDKPLKIKIDRFLGYTYFIDRDHPLSSKDVGKVYYHRNVKSLDIGRWVREDEIIHHIDGNKKNNSAENLKILDRSSHNKLHKGEAEVKNCLSCGHETINKKYCSRLCCEMSRRIVNRPTKETLEQELKVMSWVSIGKKYGVSDNAIRKWARRYKII